MAKQTKYQKLKFVKAWQRYAPGDIIQPRPLYGQAFIDDLISRGICEVLIEEPERRPEAATVVPAERATLGKAKKRVRV